MNEKGRLYLSFINCIMHECRKHLDTLITQNYFELNFRLVCLALPLKSSRLFTPDNQLHSQSAAKQRKPMFYASQYAQDQEAYILGHMEPIKGVYLF